MLNGHFLLFIFQWKHKKNAREKNKENFYFVEWCDLQTQKVSLTKEVPRDVEEIEGKKQWTQILIADEGEH